MAPSDNFGGTFTLGQNLNARNYRTFSVVGRGLVAPQPFSMLNTLTRDPPSDYQSEIHNESYFGQATFDLFNQLYLTAALRNDGSTTFGTAESPQLVPEGERRVDVHECLSSRHSDFGKARVSYGEAGQEPQPYLTSPTFSGTIWLAESRRARASRRRRAASAVCSTTFTKPAATLKPERTKETRRRIRRWFLGARRPTSALHGIESKT